MFQRVGKQEVMKSASDVGPDQICYRFIMTLNLGRFFYFYFFVVFV